MGMKTQNITISDKKIINVVLRDDTEALDEVIVVGYGVQKKKLVTGSTVQVKGDDLTKLNTVSALGALQSQSPGVNITKGSGMPGEGYKVSIRGIGTTGNSSPLYVVDGITVSDINNINPSDIESIDVLKDAASAAIYGARAANGVILVTTKQGKKGKMAASYDGYFGIQNLVNNVTPLNAQQYVEIMDEAHANSGAAPIDYESLVPNFDRIKSGEWKGTNWLKEISNKNAPTQNHAFNLQGGSEMSVFSFGLSYTSQEGIIGKPATPKYERYNVRLNSEHTLVPGNNFDIVKFGENLNISYITRNTAAIGDKFGNDIRPTLSAAPLFSVRDDNGDYTYGNIAFAFINPVAAIDLSRPDNINNSAKLNGNIYVNIQPIKNLIYRSSFGVNYFASSGRSYTPEYDIYEDKFSTADLVKQNMSIGMKWMFENTVTYKFNIKEKHNFDALLGTSAEKSGIGETLSVANKNSIFNDLEHAYIDNAYVVDKGNTKIYGKPHQMGRLLSFFGRVNYNYEEKYMATAVMRADGSSNFAKGNRWGYFPSLSAGWVISNEGFMKDSYNWLDFLKMRASWGQNGNQGIDPFQYLSTIAFDTSYSFGQDDSQYSQGAYPNILPNENVTWETSEQVSVGLDAGFLNNRLRLNFEWYNKDTKDWLVKAPIPSIMGTGAPFINGGDVRNRGIEVGLSWRDQIKDFSYGVNASFSKNKNEVLRIANSEGIIRGKTNVLSHSTDWFYAAQEGHPIGYFYGYKTGGVFQNQKQIDAYVNSKGEKIMPDAVPGDLIFVNQNDDNRIDGDDKVSIGDPNPDYNFSLAINLGWNGLDFSVTANGVAGNQIARAYRSFSQEPRENYTTEILARWHGEGTSNTIPRLTTNNHINDRYISDRYIEDGDYLRISNMTLGYDFKNLWKRMPLNQMRIYATAQNLHTFTGYKGLDPEVGYGGDNWAGGIDVGFYPMPRTFLFGISINY